MRTYFLLTLIDGEIDIFTTKANNFKEAEKLLMEQLIEEFRVEISSFNILDYNSLIEKLNDMGIIVQDIWELSDFNEYILSNN